MCHSYINAAKQWDFQLRIACPKGFDPAPELVKQNADRVEILRDPKEAVRGANWVATDVWASMGQESEQQERLDHFAGYQVNHELMDLADTPLV